MPLSLKFSILSYPVIYVLLNIESDLKKNLCIIIVDIAYAVWI